MKNRFLPFCGYFAGLSQTFAWLGLVQFRHWLMVAVIGLALGLSGCVQADLGITITGQAGGEIRQHLQVAQAYTPTLERLQHQARQLGGHIKRQNQALDFEIPFDRPDDLTAKLNQLLAPLNSPEKDINLPPIPTQAQVQDQNLLLFIRGRFEYEVDLRAWGITADSQTKATILSPGPLLGLTLSLTTPWGSRPVAVPSSLATQTLWNPNLNKRGHTVTWTLEPGYLNHLEVVFLYPSPLAWGTLGIIGLLVGAWYWRYRPLILASESK